MVQGMDVQLWRLTWALPLVIAIGWGVILMLKRLGLGGSPVTHSEDVNQAVMLNNQPLSDQTRVLLVRAAGRTYVVFESTAQLSVHEAMPASQGSVTPLPLHSPVSFFWRRWGRTS
jgi:flagellar biogenesis protein FliO